MRVKITYEAIKGYLVIPIHYNYIIQSLIYKTFSPYWGEKLHNTGFAYGKRRYKLFTFSRIKEKGEKVTGKRLEELTGRLKSFPPSNGALFFNGRVSFLFSSPIPDIVTDFSTESFTKREFNLLNQQIFLSSLEIMTPPRLEEKLLIRMLSPVTMYSTLKTMDGRKITHYYKPTEEDFSRLLEDNAKKKYFLIGGVNKSELNLKIKPIHFSVKVNQSIVIFKNTPIEGWTGVYELSGSRELIMATYEAGLGSKNPEGFGMWEVWGGKRKEE